MAKIKVCFDIRSDDLRDPNPVLVESLWADRIGPTWARLDNAPFFARDISCGDVVEIERRGQEEFFVCVAERGGHSTVRLVVEHPGLTASDIAEPLRELGCRWEVTTPGSGTVAVDVPPEADFLPVAQYFTELEERGFAAVDYSSMAPQHVQQAGMEEIPWLGAAPRGPARWCRARPTCTPRPITDRSERYQHSVFSGRMRKRSPQPAASLRWTAIP